VQRESAARVLALSLATGGVAAIVCLARRARDLERLGARIPAAWNVPRWLWRFAGGVAYASAGRIGRPFALACVIVAPVGVALLQVRFNRLLGTARASRARSCPRPSRRRHR
jgi:hypothetical protein